MEQQFSVAKTRTYEFALPRHVYKIIIYRSCPRSKHRITRPIYPDAFEQSQCSIHRETEVGGIIAVDCSEFVYQIRLNIVRQLPRHLCLPTRQNLLSE